MNRSALQVIRDEHQALAAMLRSLLLMLSQARREHAAPRFDVLRAMLFYIDEFPERLHHTKETELLFPKVRARCPQLAPVLARLQADHERGEAEVRRLQHALLAWEVLGDEGRAQVFEHAAQRYVQGYLQHMALEEAEVLPAAQAHLLPADWAELDQAFAANRDPLAGPHEPDAQYAPLFHKIVREAPAPVGLG